MGPDALATYVKSLGPPKVWAIGTVTAVNAPVVTVSWFGDTFDVHYLDSYTPHVNDVVFMITGGQQIIVLGSISS